MPGTQVVKGRLIDSKTVQLDQPVQDVAAEVQVVVQSTLGQSKPQFRSFIEFLDSLPSGTRSREDIDQQIAEERAAWGDDR